MTNCSMPQLPEINDLPARPVLPCRFQFGDATVAGAFDLATGVAFSSMRDQEVLDYTGRVDILFGAGEQPLFEDVMLVGGHAMSLSPAALTRGWVKLQPRPARS